MELQYEEPNKSRVSVLYNQLLLHCTAEVAGVNTNGTQVLGTNKRRVQ
jgi:hypothetical protein